MSTTIIYVGVNTILDFPITYKNTSVICQLECTCLHQTENIVVFFTQIIKLPTQKGEHSCKCTELSLKWKEGVVHVKIFVLYLFDWMYSW